MVKLNNELLSLKDGYKRFKTKYLNKQERKFDQLVKFGQRPKTLIVACSDSRVDPAVITDSNPGDLFVVRNIANLVPPYENDHLYHHGTSAALEYGVKHLKVTNIIIFGHSCCGGIKTLLKQPDQKDSDFISEWMKIATPAKEKIKKQYSTASLNKQISLCEKESLLISYNNLTTFPWIQNAVSKNKLFLHAWYFDLKAKTIEIYDPQKIIFVPLI